MIKIEYKRLFLLIMAQKNDQKKKKKTNMNLNFEGNCSKNILSKSH
jgi:hypothetical protein